MNITDNEGIRLLMEMVGMPSWPSIVERYNVSPTQTLDTLIQGSVDADGSIEAKSLQWGLIPPWAKPGQFKRPLINARSETVWEKPSFKHLMKSQRALVPINGFYEWRREGKDKTPYYIYPKEGSAMLLGALYQLDAEGNGQVTLMTTASNDEMTKVHHRMPVIIPARAVNSWLQESDQSVLNELMLPSPDGTLQMHEVNNYVNSSRNEGPQCVEAA